MHVDIGIRIADCRAIVAATYVSCPQLIEGESGTATATELLARGN
jgi:hypothetical protein